MSDVQAVIKDVMQRFTDDNKEEFQRMYELQAMGFTVGTRIEFVDDKLKLIVEVLDKDYEAVE